MIRKLKQQTNQQKNQPTEQPRQSKKIKRYWLKPKTEPTNKTETKPNQQTTVPNTPNPSPTKLSSQTNI